MISADKICLFIVAKGNKKKLDRAGLRDILERRKKLRKKNKYEGSYKNNI